MSNPLTMKAAKNKTIKKYSQQDFGKIVELSQYLNIGRMLLKIISCTSIGNLKGKRCPCIKVKIQPQQEHRKLRYLNKPNFAIRFICSGIFSVKKDSTFRREISHPL